VRDGAGSLFYGGSPRRRIDADFGDDDVRAGALALGFCRVWRRRIPLGGGLVRMVPGRTGASQTRLRPLAGAYTAGKGPAFLASSDRRAVAGVRTAREQSGNTSPEKVVGEWVVIVITSDGTEPEGGRSPLIGKADGDRLTGKVILNNDGEKKEWVLIDPKFDGETFTFKVDNGEELLAATLKLKNDQFEGSYQGAVSGIGGKLKLVRKK
jgi:hypothetical protein